LNGIGDAAKPGGAQMKKCRERTKKRKLLSLWNIAKRATGKIIDYGLSAA
jgi:hypothetical protein